jgi:Gas vesicle synthesis protein GvpO
MAERRTVRTKRRDDDQELAEPAEDELADDELADDELADDELADEEPAEDDLAEDHLAEDEPAEDEPAEDELADDEAGDPAEEDPEQDSAGRPRSRDGRDGRLTAGKAGRLAVRQISELTGKPTEGVTGIEPAEDGWTVGVEVVEDRRIPSSTDILATYETELDMDGELVSYRRVKRYTRGRGDSEDS